MAARIVARVEHTELVTMLRSRFCLLYGCIADASGATLSAVFRLLREYWLCKYAELFDERVVRQRNPDFVAAFERTFGAVVPRPATLPANAAMPARRTAIGAPVFRSALEPARAAELDGLCGDNSSLARGKKRIFAGSTDAVVGGVGVGVVPS